VRRDQPGDANRDCCAPIEKLPTQTPLRPRPIRGTTDWRKYEIVLDVPDDSAGIFFGLLLIGPRGKAWVDDLNLEIVDNKVPTTNKAPDPRYAALRVRSHPINLGFENGYESQETPTRDTGGIFEGGGGILTPPKE
jgi:hypothetical protein